MNILSSSNSNNKNFYEIILYPKQIIILPIFFCFNVTEYSDILYIYLDDIISGIYNKFL